MSSLSESTLPAAFRSADLASLAGQEHALSQIRWSLCLGILAAATGAVSWKVGERELDVVAAVGLLAFLGALVFTLRLGSEGYETRWYRGRAAAESVKTLAWRYAVGGDPFGRATIPGLDERFLDRVNAVLHGATGLQLAPVTGEQITGEMRALRAQRLADRRSAYISDRVDDQERWYAAKAASNEASAKRWSAAAVAMNAIGVAGAFGRFAAFVDIDVLGIAAAAAGSATAWAQLRQHRVLATSYALAAQELSLAREKLRNVTNESDWALAVSDAEDAISREHTMWLARHGHP